MTELKFVPALWCEEISASPATTPDAFIQRFEGKFVLRPFDKEEAADVETFSSIVVADGDTVDFREFRDFGTFQLEIDEDGKWTLQGGYPAYANYFAIEYDWESATDSVAQLIEYSNLDRGETHRIAIYWWGEGRLWRFVVADETAKFVQIEGDAQ